MKCSSLFLVLFLCLLTADLSAHKRDYLDSCVEDDNPYLVSRSTPSLTPIQTNSQFLILHVLAARLILQIHKVNITEDLKKNYSI